MRALNDLLDECDLHLLALGEAMARCPQPLTEDHPPVNFPVIARVSSARPECRLQPTD